MFKAILVNLLFLALTGCGNKESNINKEENGPVNTLKYFQNYHAKDGSDISAFSLADSIPDFFTPSTVKLASAKRK